MTKFHVTIEEKVFRTITLDADSAADAESKDVTKYNEDLAAFIISDWEIDSIFSMPLSEKKAQAANVVVDESVYICYSIIRRQNEKRNNKSH